MLTPNLQDAPVTICLMNVGIFRLSRETDAAGTPVAKVEMYCERMGPRHQVA